LSTRFSSLSELLSADLTVTRDYAGGDVASVLACARSLMVQALGDELQERPSIGSGKEAAAFLKQLIGFRADELLIALYLDARRRLIDYEIVARGRPDSVDFDGRRILLQAMGRGATGMIIAHNHPSGDPRPSRSDVEATRRLAHVADGLGVHLIDHLVVAGGEVRSAMFG
jgi:DNA repair protein RadC